MTATPTAKQQLKKDILITLGNSIVEVDDHLTPEDLDTAIRFALQRYRNRAGNAQEESIGFLILQPDVQDYYLPKEVVEVREIFRRGISTASSTTTGNQFDPFDIAFSNIYLLQAGGTEGLATFELYNQYLETAGRLYGSKYNFTFDPRTKLLRIIRQQRVDEEVLLWLYNHVPDDSLILDEYGSGTWIREYATAQAKMILGQAYEKFSSIAGPQGGTTLNGSQLKAEAQADMERLDQEIKYYYDHSNPLGFLIG